MEAVLPFLASRFLVFRGFGCRLMSHETPPRLAQATDGGGRGGGSSGEPAPLQTRAYFLENWDWASVTAVNRRLCARGGAQHGANPEAHEAVAKNWEAWRQSELTLAEVFDHLRTCHRRAPFLFFNGNTFAELGRTLATAVFGDLPTVRRKEAASAVAHYITGTLNRKLMTSVIRDLEKAAAFAPGDRVRTLRGSMHGIVTRLLDDGRVAVRPDGGASELISLPESLCREG
jgi:hypothetical protein